VSTYKSARRAYPQIHTNPKCKTLGAAAAACKSSASTACGSPVADGKGTYAT
jgi:hypothetical protein